MRTRLRAAALLTILGTAPLFAQDALKEPLSAIDWLSDTVREIPAVAIPRQPAKDVATTATPSVVTVSPLGRPSKDAVGILSRAQTGLSADFWGRSGTKTLVRLIADQRRDLMPPLAELMQRILLAELDPPLDSTPQAELFLARVDRFLQLGALDQAAALLQQAGPDSPDLFRRWFDVSLLTDQEHAACAKMVKTPDIAPTYSARIFCLARAGKWDAADLTLETAQTLGLIEDGEDKLLARFLDPELFEGAPFLPVPERITPLKFLMHDAIGEPLAQGSLPNAFAFAALSENEGWKARLSAAERLVRTSAIPEARLFAIYSERDAAASGGVWDRVDAAQALEQALERGDIEAISRGVVKLTRAMRSGGLNHALGAQYGEALLRYPLSGAAQMAAAKLALLSDGYEAAVASENYPEDAPAIWAATARGLLGGLESSNAVEAAVIAAFTTAIPPPEFDDLLQGQRVGEAVLRAIALLEDGLHSDPRAIEVALTVLRAVNMEDSARKTALHILVLRPA